MIELIPLNILIESRKEKGWTQRELAKKANISRSMLSNIERGEVTPSLFVAYRISRALGKRIEDIFFNGNVHETSVKVI